MRTRKEMKIELSEMQFEELQRYEQILRRNEKMGVTHLESMEVNDLQLSIIAELIRQSFNPDWNYSHK